MKRLFLTLAAVAMLSLPLATANAHTHFGRVAFTHHNAPSQHHALHR